MRTLTVLLSLLIVSPALAAGESEPSVFAGSLIQSITAVIVFALLFALLFKYAWGPILNGLQDREKKIADDLKKAESANRAADQTLAEYKKQLADAHAEARRLIEDSKKEADALRVRLTADTEKELARLRERATDDIRLAKQQAVQEIYAQAGVLATAVASKILQREVTSDDTQRLVQESLNELDNIEKAG